VNKVCLSGVSAIAMADQMIKAGDIEIAVAGGMESMTSAPYLLPDARFGSRLGDAKMVDSMVHDGLWSTFTEQHMGDASDDVNKDLGISRESQDHWSARSHQRAEAAWAEGRLAEEVVPVEVPQRKGDPVVFAQDDGIRGDTTHDTLALVIMSKGKALDLGLEPLAEIVSYGMSAERYSYLHTVPALALQNAAKKAGIDVHDLGLIEINEAFAAVAVNSTQMLGVSEDIVNVNGGAVALGHPIGASGARIVLTLAYEMKRRGVDVGGASICGGGGQGDALIIRRAS
jgi:acetyl-CoA C-acetyltransferase